jgi:hypothetical protein
MKRSHFSTTWYKTYTAGLDFVAAGILETLRVTADLEVLPGKEQLPADQHDGIRDGYGNHRRDRQSRVPQGETGNAGRRHWPSLHHRRPLWSQPLDAFG